MNLKFCLSFGSLKPNLLKVPLKVWSSKRIKHPNNDYRETPPVGQLFPPGTPAADHCTTAPALTPPSHTEWALMCKCCFYPPGFKSADRRIQTQRRVGSLGFLYSRTWTSSCVTPVHLLRARGTHESYLQFRNNCRSAFIWEDVYTTSSELQQHYSGRVYRWPAIAVGGAGDDVRRCCSRWALQTGRPGCDGSLTSAGCWGRREP